MNSNSNFSVCLNILDRKIANLNLQIINNSSIELKNELNKYLKIKKDLYSGNISLIDKVISDNI